MKSSEKWVKYCEMSQISQWEDFQQGLWVLEVTCHFKAGAVKHHNQFYELSFVISTFVVGGHLATRETVSLHI